MAGIGRVMVLVMVIMSGLVALGAERLPEYGAGRADPAPAAPMDEDTIPPLIHDILASPDRVEVVLCHPKDYCNYAEDDPIRALPRACRYPVRTEFRELTTEEGLLAGQLLLSAEGRTSEEHLCMPCADLVFRVWRDGCAVDAMICRTGCYIHLEADGVVTVQEGHRVTWSLFQLGLGPFGEDEAFREAYEHCRSRGR